MLEENCWKGKKVPEKQVPLMRISLPEEKMSPVASSPSQTMPGLE